MENLFASRRQRLGLGEVGHMGGHMGVVINKNIKACNPPSPSSSPEPIAGVYRYFGLFNLCHSLNVIKAGGGGGLKEQVKI